jgi:hypothetical protein
MNRGLHALAVLAFLASCAAPPKAPAPGASSPASKQQRFVYELANPRARISIPDLPAIELGPHPMSAGRPHLRALGSSGEYTVSVITPTADAGMTPVQCASSTATSIMRRYNLSDTSVFRGRANDRTFVLIYGLPQPGFVQLHAHILSAAGGTHCVEVHVSKVSTDPADAGTWMRSFGSSDVEGL